MHSPPSHILVGVFQLRHSPRRSLCMSLVQRALFSTISMSTTKHAVSFEDVKAAKARIAGQAAVTPVLTCSTLDQLSGLQLFFKCENFQKAPNRLQLLFI